MWYTDTHTSKHPIKISKFSRSKKKRKEKKKIAETTKGRNIKREEKKRLITELGVLVGLETGKPLQRKIY